jgi:hypothetical protein
MSAPKWFRIGIDGKWSQFDHLFATQFDGTEGDPAKPACGVDAYAVARNPATVGFAEPDGFTDQCPACLEWQAHE